MINLLICFFCCFIRICSNWITAKLSPFPKRQQEKQVIQCGHYLLLKLKISIAFWFLSTLEKWWENSLPNIAATIQHSATDQNCLFCSDQFCCVNRSEYFESTAQHLQLILTDSMEGKFSLPPSPSLTSVTTINILTEAWGNKAPCRLTKGVLLQSIAQIIVSLQYSNKAVLLQTKATAFFS